ncbi:MAG: DUF1232 domain-containing protein [Myxococcales bacterium]|nr:DUF1232 domain-containing protein [Myxococcales bacterium]
MKSHLRKFSTYRLDASLKSIIEKSYGTAVTGVGVHECDYIKRKFSRKYNATICASQKWVADLARCYGILYDVFSKYCEGEKLISDAGFNFIVAALFYFINPFDVIPDHMADIGYYDDLYVLQICLGHLSYTDYVHIQMRFTERQNACSE